MSNVRTEWKCSVCGYIHVGDTPPENCIICGAAKSEFREIEEKKVERTEKIDKWRCLNCEYIHAGDTPPDKCPVCGVAHEEFEPYIPKKISATVSFNLEKIVIIGSGIAGLSAAEEIRKNSKNTEIVMISKDKNLPYYRLNLSRYLAGEITRESLFIHDKQWYKDNKIQLKLDTNVVSIDKENKKVNFENGKSESYDKLILAAGAHPFIPPLKGNDLENVTAIRTIEDVDFVLEKIKEIDSCVCIGGGILGLEIAGALAKKGIKVNMLEGSDWLMPRQLNKVAGNMLMDSIADIGIVVHRNTRAKEILGTNECTGVLLKDGSVIDTKLVIIATGIRPNTVLARKAELEVDKGLVVNNYLKTSREDILSAGDITEHYGVLYGLWNAALYQGKIAGLCSIGVDTQFAGFARSNILKVLDFDLFSIGQFSPLDGSYTEYEKTVNDQYYMIMMRDEKIIGSIIIGNKSLSMKINEAMEKELYFPPERFENIDQVIDFVENI